MPQHSKAKVDADYIYCILNKGRPTLTELSSFTHMDVLALTKALVVLRIENELLVYQEDGKEYLDVTSCTDTHLVSCLSGA